MIQSKLSRAVEIVPFTFPKDYGKHPDFRMEWWYLAGRLLSETGYRWAYHFTIFRRAFERLSDLVLVGLAIASKRIRRLETFKHAFARMLESSNSLKIGIDGYVGHLSLVSLEDRKSVFFERGATSMFGKAGAQTESLDVWVKDWRFRVQEEQLLLKADRAGYSLDLLMKSRKAPTLHGDRGLNRKGSQSGQASYHYSLPSLTTEGILVWDGAEHRVQGKSLMDREYGTAMLPRTIRGWDWFGLFLDNDHEIMVSVIRGCDGAATPYSGVTVVLPDGSCVCLDGDSLCLEALRVWTSPVSGARYPIAWTIAISDLDLLIHIEAEIEEQELVSTTSTTVDYWEGPVLASGEMGGVHVEGFGHVELVGYAEPVGGKF